MRYDDMQDYERDVPPTHLETYASSAVSLVALALFLGMVFVWGFVLTH